LNSSMVGILSTLNRWEISGFWSTFSLAIFTTPAYRLASWFNTGAIILQGPHQGAQQSSITGPGKEAISELKVASVTVTGRVADVGSGFWHLPQMGRSASLSRGTRFRVPQWLHLKILLSVVISPLSWSLYCFVV